MKVKTLGIAIICVIMCLIITGCGNASKDDNSNGNNNYELQTSSETTGVVDKRTRIANTWMSLPKNVDMVWKMEEKETSDYSTTEEYKRDNNLFSYTESVQDGVVIAPKNHNTFTNEFYYYHYQGDYIWTSYVYFHDMYWDNWYFKGNYPSSPQNYCFGKPWDILEEYSDEHEIIEIEGVGKVDTVKGVNDEGQTYYYSKDLNMNVKIDAVGQSWTLKNLMRM